MAIICLDVPPLRIDSMNVTMFCLDGNPAHFMLILD